MTTEIAGGQTRKLADVTHKLSLRTLAQSISPQFDATYRHGMAWTIFDTRTPTGAVDYFLYISNDDDLRDNEYRAYYSAKCLASLR